MENEDKIIELLCSVKDDISTLKADVSVLKADMSAMKKDVEDAKQRIASIEVTQENIVIPQIQTIAESVSIINDKLITRSEFESIKEEVAFLKDIIRMHTSQLNDLRKAQ